MIDFLKSFKSLIKVEKIHTDNNVFKMHYKLTVIMLVVFSILLTSKQYFGEPIDCDVQERREFMNTYCWIFGTYTLKNGDAYGRLRGLGNDVRTMLDTRQNGVEQPHRLYHFYYQWVCIVFCFQALMFYLPRYLWKRWEGGLLRQLVEGLTDPVTTNQKADDIKRKLIAYMTNKKYSHNVYALHYLLCEVLNLANITAQLCFLDWFLTGQFYTYGTTVLASNARPLTHIFPLVSKCTYYRYGSSGSEEHRDALCVLTLNVLNEKLFLILWFWMYPLLFLSIVAVLYRCLFLICPTARVYLLLGKTRNVGCKKARAVVDDLTYGDCFLLYNIGKNVNFVVYKELINAIYDNVRARRCVKSLAESTRVMDA